MENKTLIILVGLVIVLIFASQKPETPIIPNDNGVDLADVIDSSVSFTGVDLLVFRGR